MQYIVKIVTKEYGADRLRRMESQTQLDRQRYGHREKTVKERERANNASKTKCTQAPA